MGKDNTFHICPTIEEKPIPNVPSNRSKCHVCHEAVWSAKKQTPSPPKGAKKICWTCFNLWRHSNPDEKLEVIN